MRSLRGVVLLPRWWTRRLLYVSLRAVTLRTGKLLGHLLLQHALLGLGGYYRNCPRARRKCTIGRVPRRRRSLLVRRRQTINPDPLVHIQPARFGFVTRHP